MENYHAYRLGTDHGEIKFGHIHDDDVLSGVLIRTGRDAGRHYFQMDSTGDRKGGTIFNCPGTFQVVCGEDVSKDIPGFKVNSKGDIIIGAPGKRIKIFAENIELLATGPDGKNGVITLDANEKVIIKAPMIDVKSTISTTIFSEKTVETIGNAILNIYGGLIEFSDGATSLKGSKVCPLPTPATKTEVVQKIKDLISNIT
jgi:hypothetical protein